MILENLQVGQTFKNYRELCKYIGEPYLTGSNRITQLKEFNNYFLFENTKPNSREITITQIFNNEELILNQQQTLLNNSGSRSTFVNHIQILILQMLSECKGYTVNIKRRELWEYLGFFNSKYCNATAEEEFLAINTDIDNKMLSEFKSRTYKKFDDIMKSALDSLRRRRIIDWSRDTIITDSKGKTHLATNKDKKIIREAEYDSLIELGYTTIDNVWAHKEAQKYYDLVYSKLEQYNWIKYENVIHIGFTEHIVKFELEKDKLKMEKKIINSLVKQATDKQAKNMYKKYLTVINEHLTHYDKPAFIVTEEYRKMKDKKDMFYPDYVEIQERLSDEFIMFVDSEIEHENEFLL